MTAAKGEADDARAAEIARDLQRAVRAEGTQSLVRVIASLAERLERVEEMASDSVERLSTVEVAADALSIPSVRASVEEIELPASVTVSADMPLTQADGFHSIEYAQSGDVYRWTGANGQEFGFVLVVDRSQELVAELALWPRGPGMDPVPAALHCTVDGQHQQAIASGREAGMYEVRLPARDAGAFTQLRFTTQVGTAEAEADDRLLGVPFRYLMVGPDAEG